MRRADRRRVLVRRALLFGAILVALLMAVLWLQRALLFPRYMVRAHARAGDGVRGLERLWIDTDQGRVEAWFLRGDGASAEAPGPAVLFAHGNGELIEQWPEALEAYRHLGVSVLLPEYRGYGRSAGSPSEDAIRDDFARFYDLLAARPEVDRSRIVLHGRSLGGGAVCTIAARHQPSAMVLQSTFTSVADVAWEKMLVPSFLVRDRFDNLSVVTALDTPILVVHGRRDGVIPFSHAKRLVHAAKHARLVAYDADHNDCPPHWAPFWSEVEAFLRDADVLR